MAEKKHIKSKHYSGVKEGKYWNFICDCGGKMFNNTYKKSQGEVDPRTPDLKCMNKECEYGSQNGKYFNPNSQYFGDKEKEIFGIKDKSKKSTKTSSKSTSGNKSNDSEESSSIGTSMEISYYGKWAMDLAIYLDSKSKKETAWDDFQELYTNCLGVVGDSLKRHIKDVSKAQDKKVEKEVEDDVDDISLDDEVGEPEDVEEPEETKEVDDSFDDVDDIEL